MRNIALSDCESRLIVNLENCEAFCQDRQTIYAYDKGRVIKCQASGDEVIIDLKDNLYPVIKEDSIPKAVEISYSWEKNALYIILYNGDIVSLQEKEPGSESIEGSVEGGIKTAKWSPEKEVIAIVTGNDSVIVMTNNFDAVSEVNLHDDDFGEKEFVTVGWGKQETQFRGSEGKFSAKDKKKEDFKATGEAIVDVKLSWRSDAEYFVISSINPDTGKRYFKIFSKNGSLQYTSENVNGLEHSLDWSPSGSLITSSQVFPNKYVVCFFEKNGLKHGEFPLPKKRNEIKVSDIFWNKDSKILAILITSTTNSNKYIQFYTVSNYHWHCKYVLNFNGSVPLAIQWDNHKCNTLHVMLRRGNEVHHCKYSWLWTLHKSRGKRLEDESLVAVIDEKKLKLSSFKRGIIPPPMCNHEILFKSSVNSVSFAPHELDAFSTNDLCVLLSDNSLAICKISESNSNNLVYELVNEVRNFCDDSETCVNIQWVDSKTFVLCIVKMVGAKSQPILRILDVDLNEQDVSFTREDIALKATVTLMRASKSAVLIHDSEGQVYSFVKSKKQLERFAFFNKPLIDMEIADKENGSFHFYCLDNSNKFYRNSSNVLSDVFSFHIHENFILLTTTKHELICLNAENEITGSNLPEIYKRKIERGSRILTSVQENMKVILQMPRGNLECIQPRPLSIYVLGKYLDSLKYFQAFDLMRKQRINFNLLYDHNPVLFTRNIQAFLDQIEDMQWISLFLSNLINEDVTKTMYSSIYKNKDDSTNTCPNKISTVCELMEKAFSEKPDSEKYTLPLLACYIKRGSLEYLEKALLKLKELQNREASGNATVVSFDEAFKFVCYLIDFEELYKVALGMYDFDLVVIVANKSQKDPKEYLEFLNELKDLTPDYQKFKINKYLKRYKKALTHLVTCEGDETFAECIQFIKSNNLYKHALKLIPENTDRYKNVCICYAEELIKGNMYEEAGIMYQSAGRHESALSAYRRSGNWREVLICSKELKFAEEEIRKLYSDIAFELCGTRQYKESATIYLDYLNDVVQCLRVLCKGKLYAEACRIAYLHKKSGLISEIIVPEALEQANMMDSHVGVLHETFVKKRDRIAALRKEKMEASEEKNEFDDLYSETQSVSTQASTTSRSTSGTRNTTKNKRKLERKMMNLKEGNPYEDLALITFAHNIGANCVVVKTELKELLPFLVKAGHHEKAENLQRKCQDFFKTVEASKSQIWTPDLINRRHVFGPKTTSNDVSAMFLRSEGVLHQLLNDKFVLPPDTGNNIKWELEILKP